MTRTHIRTPSPNHDARDPSVALRYIVLHYTGMDSGAQALERLCDPSVRVSAHYMIEEDGRIYQLVDESRRAWHAGQSFWRGIKDLNSASIGVELVNPGHQIGYRPFPATQIAALVELSQDIVQRHKLDPALAFLGHSDIAPRRKEDPGELFPWQKLAENGMGIWPTPSSLSEGASETGDGAVQRLLRAIGYDCPDNGVYDRATRAALLAFQRRFDPANLTGTPELSTIARLKAVMRVFTQEPQEHCMGEHCDAGKIADTDMDANPCADDGDEGDVCHCARSAQSS